MLLTNSSSTNPSFLSKEQYKSQCRSIYCSSSSSSSSSSADAQVQGHGYNYFVPIFKQNILFCSTIIIYVGSVHNKQDLHFEHLTPFQTYKDINPLRFVCVDYYNIFPNSCVVNIRKTG